MSDEELANLSQSIGRKQISHDQVTEGLIERFRATLADGEDVTGDAVPLALHWCLAPPAVPEHLTGLDGHPATGSFIPEIANARRMWGGGEVFFHDDFQAGDEVERVSTIADIAVKNGRSGRLVIVGVDHQYTTGRGIAVTERQNLVYRDGVSAVTEKPSVGLSTPNRISAEHTRFVNASTLLMFRYSALTFNGHRIHYDRDYAMNVEGYPGLVFHGPLQATLLMNFAHELSSARSLKAFSYKGVKPLFQGERFSINANKSEDGFSLFVANAKGETTMEAQARI